MRTLILGYASRKIMFIKRKKNRSGTTSIVVAEKIKGEYSELATIGIAKTNDEIEALAQQGREWIDRERQRRQPSLDLFGEERERCETERLNVEQFLSNITNITIDGADHLNN